MDAINALSAGREIAHLDQSESNFEHLMRLHDRGELDFSLGERLSRRRRRAFFDQYRPHSLVPEILVTELQCLPLEVQEVVEPMVMEVKQPTKRERIAAKIRQFSEWYGGGQDSAYRLSQKSLDKN